MVQHVYGHGKAWTAQIILREDPPSENYCSVMPLSFSFSAFISLLFTKLRLCLFLDKKKKKNWIVNMPLDSLDWIQGQKAYKKIMWREVAQSCPTLCDPIDCSVPGSSVHGIFQAIVLEWIAISFSRGSSQPRAGTRVPRFVDRRFTVWATREVKVNATPQHLFSSTFLAKTGLPWWNNRNCHPGHSPFPLDLTSHLLGVRS